MFIETNGIVQLGFSNIRLKAYKSTWGKPTDSASGIVDEKSACVTLPAQVTESTERTSVP